MELTKRFLFGTGSLVLGVAILALSLPKSAHGVVATLVQLVNTTANPVPVSPAIPGQPFTATAGIQFGFQDTQILGPGTGTWAVGSITAANSSDAGTFVFVSATTTTGSAGTCNGTTSFSGNEPHFSIEIPAHQTVHLTFPTPAVYAPLGGYTCVAVVDNNLTNGSVSVTLVGSKY